MRLHTGPLTAHLGTLYLHTYRTLLALTYAAFPIGERQTSAL